MTIGIETVMEAVVVPFNEVTQEYDSNPKTSVVVVLTLECPAQLE